jgi:hypothetical protein
MGRGIVLETNSQAVLESTCRAFAPYGELAAGPAQFRWRILHDPSSDLRPPLSQRVGFSDEGIRFVNFNQRAFIAIDLAEREAIGFISEELVKDEMGFLTPFLSDLFDLTSGTLGLTEVMAGCVALGDRGLLIFGPSQSGKSTSGYLAGKLGMELHADQVTCLEIVNGKLRAWGQFWPPAFRPETLEFLPELKNITRPFYFRDFTLWCLEPSRFRPVKAASVAPVSCVFLERAASAAPRLSRLSKPELATRLFQSLPFTEEACFEAQRSDVVNRLAELPAYRLRYPADPQTAAELFSELVKQSAEVHAI